MNTAILHSVQFLNIIYSCLTRVSYRFLYKSISANRHTDTNETCRTEATSCVCVYVYIYIYMYICIYVYLCIYGDADIDIYTKQGRVGSRGCGMQRCVCVCMHGVCVCVCV